jgi:hypothetical protein
MRIRREIELLNPRVRFKYSQNDMLIRLGQIQGHFAATIGATKTKEEIKRRANSIFLLECVGMANGQETPFPF